MLYLFRFLILFCIITEIVLIFAFISDKIDVKLFLVQGFMNTGVLVISLLNIKKINEKLDS